MTKNVMSVSKIPKNKNKKHDVQTKTWTLRELGGKVKAKGIEAGTHPGFDLVQNQIQNHQ